MVFNHKEVIVDAMNGEVAKYATRSKLYDRLKSVLAAKCHTNNFLGTLKYLDIGCLKKRLFPIIQIMGFSVHIRVLRFENKGIYILLEMATF